MERSEVAERPGIELVVADIGFTYVLRRAFLTPQTGAYSQDFEVAGGLDPFEIDICSY
jgi:hypothetical protein